jgi:hypothetical protein
VGAVGEEVGGVGRLKNVEMDVCDVFCFLVIGVVVDGGLRVSEDELVTYVVVLSEEEEETSLRLREYVRIVGRGDGDSC